MLETFHDRKQLYTHLLLSRTKGYLKLLIRTSYPQVLGYKSTHIRKGVRINDQLQITFIIKKN